jgi:hypothetical protein
MNNAYLVLALLTKCKVNLAGALHLHAVTKYLDAIDVL